MFCFASFGKDLQFQRHEQVVVVGELVVAVVVVVVTNAVVVVVAVDVDVVVLAIQMYSIEIPFEVVNV